MKKKVFNGHVVGKGCDRLDLAFTGSQSLKFLPANS